MKTALNIIVAFSCVIHSFAQVASIKETQAIKATPAAPTIVGTTCPTPIKIWDKRYGGGEFDFVVSMLKTNDKGYLLGGTSFSGISGDRTQTSQGYDDYWLVKTDSVGNKMWDKRFGGNEDDLLATVLPTTDGGYLIGGTSASNNTGDRTEPSRGGSDYWIVKIDADGNKLWDKRFGGTNGDYFKSMVATTDGGYLLVGETESNLTGDRTAPLKGTIRDYWLVKVDAAGNKLWDKAIGTIGFSVLRLVIPAHGGGYLLGGSSEAGIGADKSQAAQGRFDYWIVKIDENGDKAWDKSFGGSSQDELMSVIQTQDGGYLVGGTSYSEVSGDKTEALKGREDYWLVKTDANGNKLWDKSLGSSETDNLTSLLSVDNEGFLIGGSSYGNISGDKTENAKGSNDYWVIKTDLYGNKLWDKTLGGNAGDVLSANILDDNGYLLGGYSLSDISGDKSEAIRGGYDFWVIKIKTCETKTKFCGEQSITLTASNCNGTINWSNGATGNSIVVNNGDIYTATCTVDGETSAASNNVVITPNTIALNGTAASGTNQAVENITSTQTIPSGTNVVYQAGKSITLQGTFKASTGSIFMAEIKGCE